MSIGEHRIALSAIEVEAEVEAIELGELARDATRFRRTSHEVCIYHEILPVSR